jgi:hypothetical protein
MHWSGPRSHRGEGKNSNASSKEPTKAPHLPLGKFSEVEIMRHLEALKRIMPSDQLFCE